MSWLTCSYIIEYNTDFDYFRDQTCFVMHFISLPGPDEGVEKRDMANVDTMKNNV